MCNRSKKIDEMHIRVTLGQLISTLKYDAKWEARRYAAEELGDMCDRRAIDPLISAINDSHGMVRCFALRALGKIGNRRAVEPIILALKGTDGMVRSDAAEALGMIGDKRAVEPLISVLKNPDLNIEKVASEELNEMVLKRIQINATEALGKFSTSRAKKALRELRLMGLLRWKKPENMFEIVIEQG